MARTYHHDYMRQMTELYSKWDCKDPSPIRHDGKRLFSYEKEKKVVP